MAEEQKPVEVVQDAAQDAVVEVKDAAPVVDTAAPTETVEGTEDKPTESAEAAAEDKKEEVKETTPVEEGHLGHKTAGQSFPKNLLGSKEFFFFGSDALEAKALDAYKKSQKGAETALNNIAWAAETGKGLLFAGDKKAPTHVINLAHATEPETDGANKFHLTANGNKHSFKATTATERDNWVSQIKAKIAEAKELVSSVTESETYKQTLESFKPAAKEEKPAEAPKEEAAEEAKTEETPKEEGEAAKEEPKAEEPKRRSASRKRASFFGFGKKDLLPKEEAKTEEAAAPAADAAAEDKAVDAAETPAEAAAATEETPAEAAPATEEAAEEKVETPKEKSSKRNSIFGNVFSKKEKKAVETKPADATEATEVTEEGAATEAAPVIPPVEENTPLADEINNAATETTEPVETKKDVKEKRKSSLPFAFGKRDKSPAAAPAVVAEGEEKPASKSAFSKFRATIKGKGAAASAKAEEKGNEVVTTAEEKADEQTEAAKEAVNDAADKVKEAVNGTEAENKTESVATSTPAVTAAA